MSMLYLCDYALTNLLHDPPVERDCHDLPRDELTACLQRLLRGQFKAAAARNLHADDGNGLDVVLADDLSRLLIGVTDGTPLAHE